MNPKEASESKQFQQDSSAKPGKKRQNPVNAFRHSGAKNIEVLVEYADRELRIVVHDDGVGIDPKVLHSGREGHWGLAGMRERAEKIGAKLSLSSGDGGGTEVQLRVPGRIAFRSKGSGKLARWFSGGVMRKTATRG